MGVSVVANRGTLRDCPLNQPQASIAANQPTPKLCPQCHRGKHWVNECRSQTDINGQPLQPLLTKQPKNGGMGPRFQGPQMYGAMETVNNQGHTTEQWPTLCHPRDRGEPLKVPQDWTSVPPPDSYQPLRWGYKLLKQMQKDHSQKIP